MAHQDSLMRFDPATGEANPYPSHAAQWRLWHGQCAWLFDPWSPGSEALVRRACDIGSDPFGLLILPQGAALEGAANPEVSRTIERGLAEKLRAAEVRIEALLEAEAETTAVAKRHFDANVSMQRQLDALIDDRNSVAAALDKAIVEGEAARKELKREQQRHEQASIEREKLSEELKSERYSHECTVNDSEDKRRSLLARIAELEKANEASAKAVGELASKLSETREERNRLTAEIERLRETKAERDRLTLQVARLEEARSTFMARANALAERLGRIHNLAHVGEGDDFK